jgi:uncharacterized glyoxalase superfamily protein PhnB
LRLALDEPGAESAGRTHRHYVPDGWQTVTPRIVVEAPEDLVDFLRTVFDATGDYHAERPTELRIGESMLMISGSSGRDIMPAFLYVYVENTDATYRRALDAGATSIEDPREMPYGDRRAMVRDSWGNTWQIATHATAPRDHSENSGATPS